MRLTADKIEENNAAKSKPIVVFFMGNIQNLKNPISFPKKSKNR